MKSLITLLLIVLLWGQSSIATIKINVTDEIDRTVCLIGPENAQGSGAIISQDGMVATAAHVISKKNLEVRDVESLTITCDDVPKKIKSILLVDHDSDLALLQLDEPSENFAPPCEKPLKVGDGVTIAGYPGGTRTNTQGFVREIYPRKSVLLNGKNIRIVSSDAAVSPGNSGSPVLLNGCFGGVSYAGSTAGFPGGKDSSSIIDISTIKNAIDYIEKDSSYLPSRKVCVRYKIDGCSETAERLWYQGNAKDSLKLYQLQCKRGLRKDCKVAKKLDKRIKEIKTWLGWKPEDEDASPPPKEEEEIPPESEDASPTPEDEEEGDDSPPESEEVEDVSKIPEETLNNEIREMILEEERRIQREEMLDRRIREIIREEQIRKIRREQRRRRYYSPPRYETPELIESEASLEKAGYESELELQESERLLQMATGEF